MDDSSLSSVPTAKFASTLSALNWISADSSELPMLLESFKSSVSMNYLDFFRRSLKMTIVWKQPRLLRLPKNYDQIFQVNLCFVKP